LDIAFTVDAAYFEHAAVAIESILQFEYAKPVTFWMVLADDVRDGARERLVTLVGSRAAVRYVTPAVVAGYGSSTDPYTQHVSDAMYLRLQLVDLLPTTVRRVLYLDADILCVSPGLDSLFDFDLDGKTIGAVRDAFTRRMNDHGGLPRLNDLAHINPQGLYFNSGVLLIDTLAWRERDVRARAESYLEDSASVLRFPDQDALNAVCHRDWYRLDKRWNHMMAWRLEAERDGILSDAVIVHSAGPLKHWQADFPPGRRRDLYSALASKVRAIPERLPTTRRSPRLLIGAESISNTGR